MRLHTARCGALALAALCGACGAPDECSSVAKLVFHAAEHKNEVKVLRPSNGALREVKGDRLCAGDRVRVPPGISVDVKYLQAGEAEQKLEGPGEYPVIAVRAGTALGNMLKSADMFHWFHEEAREAGFEAALSRSAAAITMPLDAGQSPQVPLYVKSSLQRIAFFWKGGAGPWRVELDDASGRQVAAATAQEAKVVLLSPEHDTRQEYQLVVRSADGHVLSRKLKFEPDGEAPRAGGEPDWGGIVAMLSDPDRNWRLQVWSELEAAPESGMKTALMRRLGRDLP